MKNSIAIIGGIVSAVTCIIPLINKSGDYSDLESVLSASGLTLGAGLLSLSYGISKNKYWYLLIPISALLLSYSLIFSYDYFIDLANRVHTYHYCWILFSITFLTLFICVYYKLRRL